mmetsp:Transcript_129965/g.363791  ORF Transcript_129965/g.363791 Transcript_129965/m.363791 type:complete len:251 (+) Transcript_129965:251-1003(+)
MLDLVVDLVCQLRICPQVALCRIKFSLHLPSLAGELSEMLRQLRHLGFELVSRLCRFQHLVVFLLEVCDEELALLSKLQPLLAAICQLIREHALLLRRRFQVGLRLGGLRNDQLGFQLELPQGIPPLVHLRLLLRDLALQKLAILRDALEMLPVLAMPCRPVRHARVVELPSQERPRARSQAAHALLRVTTTHGGQRIALLRRRREHPPHIGHATAADNAGGQWRGAAWGDWHRRAPSGVLDRIVCSSAL